MVTKRVLPFIKASITLAAIVLSSLHLPFIQDDASTISKSILFIFIVGALLVLCPVVTKSKLSFSTFNRLDRVTLSFLAYSLINNFYHSEFSVNSKAMQLAGLIAFYWLSKSAYPEMVKRTKLLVVCFLFLTTIHTSIAILQWNELIPSFNESFKFSGLFNNPGPFAIYITILVVSCVAILFVEDNNMIKRVVVVLLVATGFILFVAGSRASWLGLMTALSMIVAIRSSLSGLTKNANVKTAIVSGVIICFVFFANYLYHLKKDSADGRILVWKISLGVICENPLTGVGADNFPGALFEQQAVYFSNRPDLVEAEGRLAGESSFAFNDILQLTAEHGIIGLSLFVMVVATTISSIRQIIKHRLFKKVGVQAAIGTLVVIIVSGLFSYPLTLLQFQILFCYSISVISGEMDLLNAARVNNTGGIKAPVFRVMLSGMLIITGIAFLLFSIFTYRGYREWKLAVNSSTLEQRAELLATRYRCLREDPWFNLTRAHFLLKGERYPECIDMLNLSTVRCASATVYYTLAACYESTDRYDEAIATCVFLRNALPDLVRPRYLLAKLYFKAGHLEEFKATATELIRHQPKIRSGFTEAMKQEMVEMISSLVQTNSIR